MESLMAGRNENQSFLDRQAGIFPCVDAAVEMVNRLEIVFLKVLQGLAAPAAGGAMDQVVFGFIEGVDALLEIGAVEVNVRGAGNVEGSEFFGSADIEDYEVGLR